MNITTKHYIDEAQRRGWETKWIDEERNFLALYPPNEQPILIRNNFTELGTASGYMMAFYKSVATELAHKAGFAVPETIVVEKDGSVESAAPLLVSYQRLVVKPMDGAFGDGVSTHVTDEITLQKAIATARANNIKSDAVVVQQFVAGDDHRLFILDGRLVAAIRRQPFGVTGDGQQTIEQLVCAKVSQLQAREENTIKAIELDVNQLLQSLTDYQSTEVLTQNVFIPLSGTANLSKGGEAVDITDKVHPQIIEKAVALSRLMRLDMCGIDVLSPNISKEPENAIFIEINVAPGFRGHYYPTEGQKRELAPLILDTILKKRHQ